MKKGRGIRVVRGRDNNRLRRCSRRGPTSPGRGTGTLRRDCPAAFEAGMSNRVATVVFPLAYVYVCGMYVVMREKGEEMDGRVKWSEVG